MGANICTYSISFYQIFSNFDVKSEVQAIFFSSFQADGETKLNHENVGHGDKDFYKRPVSQFSLR